MYNLFNVGEKLSILNYHVYHAQYIASQNRPKVVQYRSILYKFPKITQIKQLRITQKRFYYFCINKTSINITKRFWTEKQLKACVRYLPNFYFFTKW